jgi:YebC/PmpR family DNA-binding regulatory protein
MSGHSKWATIKHKKGAADAKRGKVFSKLGKEIMVAARKGSDLSMNPTLRAVVQKAKAANMPNDNISRAIKKGAGEVDGVSLEEINFEGFSNGVAIIVQSLTDNKNRTTSEIGHLFTRHGAKSAAAGSVVRTFVRKGYIVIDAATVEEDKLMEVALNAGAEDMKKEGDQFEVTTDPASFADVTEALEKAGIKTVSAEVSLLPMATTQVKDKAHAQSLIKFIEELEDNDDVQNVYTNMDIDDSMLKDLETTV